MIALANGLPEFLMTAFAVAAPKLASLTLLSSTLFGLGWLNRLRRKAGVDGCACLYRRPVGRVRFCPGIQVCDGLSLVLS